MTNWYNIFYWVTRGDSVKDFFDVMSNVFTTAAVIALIGVVICSIGIGVQTSENRSQSTEQDQKDADIRGWQRVRRYSMWLFYPFLVLTIVSWMGYMATPTKKEALLILAAGGTMNYLTTDSTAKQIPHEMTNFVVTELKSMAKEAQVDLGIGNAKDKILEEAKNMSGADLVERMKIDSNFRKIVTGQ
jgi:hypothetical protein